MRTIVSIMFLVYYLALVIAAVVTVEAKGNENEWLSISKNAQSSIEESVTKIKNIGASDDRIKSVTDNSFDDFVKFVKNGVTPIFEMLNKTSGSNPRIKTKLNNWIEGLERLSNSTKNNSTMTMKDSLDKFEKTIKTMVNNAPQFADKIKMASPEYHEILLEVGQFMKKVIGKLADNIKLVEIRLQNAKTITEEDEWPTNAKNAQIFIKDSVAKLKSYGVSEDRIKSVTDNAFDNLVKYVKQRATPVFKKVNGEVNVWLDEAEDSHTSIEESVSSIKEMKVSEDKIKEATNNGFKEYVIFLKKKADPIFEKLDKSASEDITNIKNRLNTWIKYLDDISNTNSNTAKESLEKFTKTIDNMVSNAAKFADNIKLIPPEHKDIATEVGKFMTDAIQKLSDELNAVEMQIKEVKINA